MTVLVVNRLKNLLQFRTCLQFKIQGFAEPHAKYFPIFVCFANSDSLGFDI